MIEALDEEAAKLEAEMDRAKQGAVRLEGALLLLGEIRKGLLE